MLTFSKPAIEDKEWVDECFKYVNSFNCEYTFGNLFVWATAYRTQIARYENFIICRWGKAPDYKYSLPIGKGNFKKAVEEFMASHHIIKIFLTNISLINLTILMMMVILIIFIR